MKIELRLFEIFRTIVAILVSLLVICIIIFFVSDDPITAISAFITQPFSSFSRFGNVIEMMIPLTFTGLAVCIMFSANQFNMISEGAFYSAAVSASLVAIYLPLPPLILPIVALLTGAIVGGALSFIPAILKIKTNSSVIVVSLMMNYILALLGRYIATNVMRDPSSGSGSSYLFQKIAKMPVIIPGTRIHLGLIVMVFAVVFTTVFISRSKMGYQIRMVGRNDKFAAYSGINVNITILASQILGGMLAGIGGTIEMLGMYSRFSWVGTPGYGWDAVIIAALARNNPALAPLAAFFLSYVRIGADSMSMVSDVPAEIVSIVQMVILLLLAANKFLQFLKDRIVRKSTLQNTIR